jgi:type IV secretion system protein VirB11
MSFAPSHASSPVPAPEEERVHAGFVRPPAVAESSALDLTLRALRPILTDREVTEICINRPGDAYVETSEGWRCVPLPFATFDWCHSLARLVANSTRQRIDAESPLLSAALPGPCRRVRATSEGPDLLGVREVSLSVVVVFGLYTE